MDCADLARIINSDTVQSKLRQVKANVFSHNKNKKNPLKNRVLMQRLNPYSKAQRAFEVKATEARVAARKAALKHKHSKAGRKEKATRGARFAKIGSELEASFGVAQAKIEAADKAGLFNPNPESDDE